MRLLWILLSWKLNILNVWICIASLIYSLSVGCTCSTGSRALKNIDDYFHSFAISLNSSCCLLKSWISPERHSFRYSFVRFSNTLISNSHYSSKWHPTMICFNCQCVPFCQKKQKLQDESFILNIPCHALYTCYAERRLSHTSVKKLVSF